MAHVPFLFLSARHHPPGFLCSPLPPSTSERFRVQGFRGLGFRV